MIFIMRRVTRKVRIFKAIPAQWAYNLGMLWFGVEGYVNQDLANPLCTDYVFIMHCSF